MKAGATILLIILSLSMIQLAVSGPIVGPAESCSSKSRCDKPVPSDGKDDCAGNYCNPLMACPVGCFYLAGHSPVTFSPFAPSKQKIALVNDNRVLTQLTECWHPPEII